MWEEGGGDELSEKCVLRGGSFFVAPVYISALRNIGMCWTVIFLLFVVSKQGVQCSVEGVEEKKGRNVLVPTESSVCNVV